MSKSKEQKLIELWKQFDIMEAIFDFSCGGDSMNDTDLHILNSNAEEINNKEFRELLEDYIYDNVSFYVNSNGSYIGEYGKVDVVLENDKLNCYKTALSEHYNSDTYTINFPKNLIEKYNDIFEYILNIRGTYDDRIINYSKDFILTLDIELKLELLVSDICKIIEKIDLDSIITSDYEYSNDIRFEGYTFTVSDKKIIINYSFIQLSPSEE